MKWSEAIANVDKSDNNKIYIDPEQFEDALGLCVYLPSWTPSWKQRVVGYGLVTWLCTDTWVGSSVHYLDGELCAVAYQRGRKWPFEINFISEEQAKKMKDFLLEIGAEDINIPLISLDEEIPNRN